MKYRNSVSLASAAFVLEMSSSMAREMPASTIVSTSGGENGPMLRKAYFDAKIVDRSKFPPQTLNPYLYPILSYSTEAFPEGGPANWKEFWDGKAFPGSRSRSNHPIDNLEAALIADGVAPRKSLSARLGSRLRQA